MPNRRSIKKYKNLKPKKSFFDTSTIYRSTVVIVLFLTFLSLIFDIPSKIINLVGHLIKTKPQLLIENEAGSQLPIQVYDLVFKNKPGYNYLKWEASYSITNLDESDITIIDFNIDWEPSFVKDKNEKSKWELKKDTTLSNYFEVYTSIGEMYETHFLEKDEEKKEKKILEHTDYFPYTLKSGQKKYFRFHLVFCIYKDNQKFFARSNKELTEFIPILIKAPMNQKGNYRGHHRPLAIILRLSKNKIIKNDVETWICSPGCVINIPELDIIRQMKN